MTKSDPNLRLVYAVYQNRTNQGWILIARFQYESDAKLFRNNRAAIMDEPQLFKVLREPIHDLANNRAD